MVYLHFPTNHTEEELMLQAKYQKLKRKVVMYCSKYIFKFIYGMWYFTLSSADLATSNVYTYPKVAIVGGGIGGTSCAYFLNELLDGEVVIDLYEASKIGGRLLWLEIDGFSYEAGGTIIHPRNKYMKYYVHKFGLKPKEDLPDKVAGLHDGEKFLFVENKSQYVTLLKLFWRYGIDVLTLHGYISNMLYKFDKIYYVQNNYQSFHNVLDLLSVMDAEFPKYLRKSIEDALGTNFNQRIMSEIVFSAMRANYGQNNLVHQFVGSVSVAGVMSGLWSIDGGNYQIAERFLQRSGAEFINQSVNSVVLIKSTSKFKVTSDNKTDEYDIVIIATPMTNDAKFPIAFLNFPNNIYVPGSYHSTVCTFVNGIINHTFFGYDSFNELPESIFTVKESLFYNSISLLNYNGENSVYKVFSQTILTDAQLNLLFKKLGSVKVIDFLAYPEYTTEPRNDTFALYKNLYYINAIEWAASAMEMSVIGAKNVALLVYNNLMKGFCSIDSKQFFLYSKTEL